MTAPDTRAEVERSWIDKHGDVWRLGEDGLMHTPETAPFPREHVEKKWGPLREVADARPAGPAQGDREALARDWHHAYEWQYGECDHDTYSGGPSHGEPYEMCDIMAGRLLSQGWTRTAPQPHADTVETVEWGVRWSEDHEVDTGWDEESALAAHRQPTTSRAYRRTRVTTPDVVGPWEVVS